MAVLDGRFYRALSLRQELDPNYKPFMSERYMEEIRRILEECEKGSPDKLTKRELCKLWKYKLLNQEYKWLSDNFDIFSKIPDIQNKIIDNCIVKGYYYAIFKNIDKMESYEKYIIEKVGEFGIWESIAGDICRFLEEKRCSYRKSRDIIKNYFLMEDVEEQEKLKRFREFIEFIKNYEFYSNLITSRKRADTLARACRLPGRKITPFINRNHDQKENNLFYRLGLRR